MSFVTTWMKLEGIMLSEISQTEKDKNHMISLMSGILTTTNELLDAENRLVVTRDGGRQVNKMGEESQKVQISSYEINNPWGCNVHYGD